jgi:spore coat polysaccharide biosynthesis protein SpsF
MAIRKVGVIIQARTDSSRFPKKVLAKIEEKPLLWHVLQRAKKISPNVILATTNRSKDDIIEKIGIDADVKIFRGNKNNVLNRYVKAAEKFNIDVIIRITSDCPLIDPNESKKVVRKFIKNNYDYVTTDDKTYPKGLDTECVSLKVLKKILDVTDDKFEKEHVTMYIYKNPKKFRIGLVKNKKKIPTTTRWVVDYKEDLEFVKKVYSKLYKKNKLFQMNDIIKLLKNNKEITHKLENGIKN